jgi:peroxiredoxin (alkyl hydroperoxide reductase subunit C)
MKTALLFIAITLLSFQSIYSQSKDSLMPRPLITGTAPSFKAVSTMGVINFPGDYYGKWKILFSHPADFTPVCTTEMLAMATIQKDFKDLNTVLIGISTDGLNSHIAWVQSIDSIASKSGNKVDMNFPLITDADFKISKLYGIMQMDSSGNKDIRGVFIIDPDNKIRAFFYYPNAVGRNVDEIKRVLMALQMEDKRNVLLPANWHPGDDVLIKSPATVKDAEKLEEKKDAKLREVTWYLWYKKL